MFVVLTYTCDFIVYMSLSTPRKRIGETGIQPHSFFTSTLDGGEWLSSRPGRLTLVERLPLYPLTTRLCGPNSLSGHLKRKISWSFGESKPRLLGRSARSVVARPTSQPRLQIKCNDWYANVHSHQLFSLYLKMFIFPSSACRCDVQCVLLTYRTRHFFNNSNTNENIATKFEQEYVRYVRNEEECICSPLQVSLQYPH